MENMGYLTTGGVLRHVLPYKVCISKESYHGTGRKLDYIPRDLVGTPASGTISAVSMIVVHRVLIFTSNSQNQAYFDPPDSAIGFHIPSRGRQRENIK